MRHQSDRAALFNGAIFSFGSPGSAAWPGDPPSICHEPGEGRGGARGFAQKHYHTNTPFSGGQSQRGAFTGPHELQGIRGGAAAAHSHSCSVRGLTADERANPLSATAYLRNTFTVSIMTFEEVVMQKPTERAQCTGKALEEVLVSAKDNDSLTVGVYECAKVMNL